MTSVTASSAAGGVQAAGAAAVHQLDGRHRARRAATIAARRSAISPAEERCMQPDRRALQRLAQRPVAHAGDVALVAHQPGQLEPVARGDLRGQRGRLLGRADRRALGADLHQPAAPCGSRCRTRCRGGSAPRAPPRRVAIRSSCSAESTITIGRPSPSSLRELRERGAVGRRVGEQQVAEAVAVQPQRLVERERHEPAEALVAREDALEHRPRSARTCWPRGSACPTERASISAALDHIASRSTSANGASWPSKMRSRRASGPSRVA